MSGIMRTTVSPVNFQNQAQHPVRGRVLRPMFRIMVCLTGL